MAFFQVQHPLQTQLAIPVVSVVCCMMNPLVDTRSARSSSRESVTATPHSKSVARAYFDPFKGNNQDGVFESLDEFTLFVDVKYGGLSHLDNMEGMVFQEVVYLLKHA